MDQIIYVVLRDERDYYGCETKFEAVFTDKDAAYAYAASDDELYVSHETPNPPIPEPEPVREPGPNDGKLMIAGQWYEVMDPYSTPFLDALRMNQPFSRRMTFGDPSGED